jgi:hypothetical protein
MVVLEFIQAADSTIKIIIAGNRGYKGERF